MSSGVRRIKLGSQGLEVSAIGLGCMGMSGGYGPLKPEQDMINLIHHAINSGVTHLDTSDVYGPHTNEILIGKALKGVKREQVQVATKFGLKFGEGLSQVEIHGEPEYVRACCEASLKRLDVDYIDLYYVHRVDTKVPIEVTMGELKKLVEEGKIRHIGLSEAGPATIRRAHAVHPITAVQLEWSLWTRDAEEEVIPTCRELGIGIVPFCPLGSGFFASGPKMMENLADNDFRKVLPRLQGENFDHNKVVFERVSEMGRKKGCTSSQLALAWVLHQGDDACPIPGTTKIENLNQNLGALAVKLTAQDMSELESMASFKGARMPDFILAHTYKNSDTPPLSSWKSEELGIGIVPFGPLGSGFLASGPKVVENVADDDYRKMLPRLQGENFDHNIVVYERVSEMAQKKGCTPSQLALAWVLHQGDDVGPIPGTTKIENLNQNLGALAVKLTAQDMAELESMASFKGARMPDFILAHTYKNSDTPPLSSWKSD